MARTHHIALPRASRSFQSCSPACFLPKSIFVRHHRTKAHSDIVLLPSRDHHDATQDRLGAFLRHCRKSHFLKDFSYRSAPFHFNHLKVFQSYSDDCFLPKCVFYVTSSIQSHFHNCLVSTLVSARAMLKPSWCHLEKFNICDVIEREPPFSTKL